MNSIQFTVISRDVHFFNDLGEGELEGFLVLGVRKIAGQSLDAQETNQVAAGAAVDFDQFV